MSRRDWIRNTRRERIVYIPVEGDGGATNLIAVRKIRVGGSIIPLSDLSQGSSTTVSIPAGQLYLNIHKNDAQTAWVFSMRTESGDFTAVPSSGDYYFIGSGLSFVLFDDDESMPIASFVLTPPSGNETWDVFSSYSFYLSTFQFHFEANE